MRVALALIAVLAAPLASGPAFAADEPMSTAGATPATVPAIDAAAVAAPVAPAPAPMTTAEQIDAFIRSAPTPDADASDAVDGVVRRDDRQVHGMVSVGVGTGGYRSLYVQSDMPVGENGRLSIAFEDTKGPRGYGRFYGGPGDFRGPAPLGLIDRQRCDLEGMSAPRPLDTMGGPNGRCVRAPGR